MAEKKPKEATASEIRDAVKERIKDAKAAGTSFKEFFATIALEHPHLKEATVYGWFQSAKDDAEKPDKKIAAQSTKDANPSEKLALLLRKEGLLVDKVRQAQAELATVRREVESLWTSRQKITEAATK